MWLQSQHLDALDCLLEAANFLLMVRKSKVPNLTNLDLLPKARCLILSFCEGLSGDTYENDLDLTIYVHCHF